MTHPLTRGLDLDAPETTALRRRIIREKRFLRRLYDEWYSAIAATLPDGAGAVVELGAGAGFLDEKVPGLIKSDLLVVPGIHLAADGLALPFARGSLRAIVMTNLLHHVSDTGRFLHGAARCVRPGGVLSMIEPWVSPWSRWVYTRLHHEPFDHEEPGWRLPPGGPLSQANGALPWIVFHRDRHKLEREHPEWRLEGVRPMMPLRYLLSGGVSMRSLAPGWSFPVWTLFERLLEPAMPALAMFAQILLRRRQG